jgi:predicted peptidase
VDQIEAKYRVDPKRIYVTGLSMGGFGSLDLAAAYPLRFAAIAPLSGGADPEIAPRIKMVPAWIFHGAVDPVVPTWYSTDLASRLKQVGADVTLTIYPGVGHEKWDVTYSNPKLYAWFLQHSLP